MKPGIPFPNIAFIRPSLADMQPSGVTTFVRQIAEGFAKYGDRFKIVEIPHGDYQSSSKGRETIDFRPQTSDLIPRGARQLQEATNENKGEKKRRRKSESSFLALGYLKLLWIDLRRVWAVRRECRKRIILTNQFGCETLPIALRLVFPLSRIVAISHTHPGSGEGVSHPVRRWVETVCYWSVNDILFNSESSRCEWRVKLGLHDVKGRVIHLGTAPPDLSAPTDYPQRAPGTVDFLCVARFAGWKGQGNLVRVWQDVQQQLSSREPSPKQLSTQQPNNVATDKRARLIFIGDGPCLDEVRRDAELAGLGKAVVFMGPKPGADRYFNLADVAVLLSTEPEAFGLTLLEAMSRGKPILASRIGGIPEIVIEGETGLLVDPFNIAKTVEAVRDLAASVSKRQRMGVNGQKRWNEQFSIQQMIVRFETYFMGTGERNNQ